MNNNVTTYFKGVSWFILSLACSALNDIISKYLGMRLPSYEVAFLRFFFSAIILLPFILNQGLSSLKSDHLIVQLFRGILLFAGITAWTYGLSISKVSTATVISFTTPLFTLILANFFLSENIIWQRWLVTIIGFVGIAITMKPNTNDFNPGNLIFLFATLAFASLDIINKKYIFKESMINMLFYSALVTAVLAFIPAINCWIKPNARELTALFLLGISANLILYFLLKAFKIIDATAVAPYRYLELVISATSAYLIYGEYVDSSTLAGALIIIPTTLFIIYSEKKHFDNK